MNFTSEIEELIYNEYLEIPVSDYHGKTHYFERNIREINQFSADYLPYMDKGFGPLGDDGFFQIVDRVIKKQIEQKVVELVRKSRRTLTREGTRKLMKSLKNEFEKNNIKMGRDQLFRILRESRLLIRRKKYSSRMRRDHFLEMGCGLAALQISAHFNAYFIRRVRSSALLGSKLDRFILFPNTVKI